MGLAEQHLTNLSFVGLSFIVVMGILLVSLPRRLAPLPIFLSACFITLGQRIDILGLNFYLLRIMILIGWVRVIFRNEISGIRLNTLDKLIICWVIYTIISFTILYGSFEAFINRLGFAYNAIGLYFLFRFLIRDFDDFVRVYKFLAIISLFLAAVILVEYLTGRNLFSILGSVPEITMIREGRLRCQGPFKHPILAGTVGALCIPFFIALWFRDAQVRLLAVTGCIAASFITVASGSSGPVMTYLSAIVGLMMWKFRHYMKAIIYGSLFVLTLIILAMKAPVWYLIARLSNFLGGTGWHRSELINQFVKHIDEWWLIGTSNNAHWMPFGVLPINPDMVDCTNQLVAEGVEGGLLKLILFISIIILCFRIIGKALRLMQDNPLYIKMILWVTGVTLFAHVVTFMSVSYFDQIIVFWYLLLAMISTISDLSRSTQAEQSNR